MLQAPNMDEEEESSQGEEGDSAQAQREGYHSFVPKAKGVLFKISPLSQELCADVERYMKEGFMDRDLTFVSTLYGLVAPSQRKEFSMFWESPWVEDQIQESNKKKKIEQQQRTLAVRTFIRASTSNPESSEDVDQFLNTVSKLTEWDKKEEGARESIKTVSRMVQSFEKKAVLTLLTFLQSGGVSSPMAMQHLNRLRGGPSTSEVDPITHALRRAPHTYVPFANLVAAELLLSEATNGTRNTTINTTRRMDLEKMNSIHTMVDVLQKAHATILPRDTLGLPLMQTTCNVCISKGVLVVAGKTPQATYILDIDNLDEIVETSRKRKKAGGLIEITAQVFAEEDAEPPRPARKKRKPEALSSLV